MCHINITAQFLATHEVVVVVVVVVYSHNS